jgi:hypothetical protein
MRRSSDASIRGKRTGEVCRGGASCSFRQQSVQASEVSCYLRHSEKGSLPGLDRQAVFRRFLSEQIIPSELVYAEPVS